MRLNARAGEPVRVSDETFDVIARACEGWRMTEGLFDPTVTDALVGAGYDRSFEEIPCSSGGVALARPPTCPGCSAIELDYMRRTVLLPPATRLDLGGIGKGFAADVVAVEMRANGAAGACVNLGGDLRVTGDPGVDHGWVVSLEDPRGGGELGRVALAEGALATTTSAKRTWTRGGVRMHHVIDPRHARPAHVDLVQVTVAAGEAWWAEVLSKAAFLSGSASAASLIDDWGASGVVLHVSGARQAAGWLKEVLE